MNDSSNALRPEAGPVHFEYLNRSQEQAMKAIVLALKEAVAQAAHPAVSDYHDATINSTRVSRLFFVSGQPGSGKSSLYYTLRAILNKNERLSKLSQEYETAIPDLLGLSGATIWLEHIDLEVAGDTEENLLAAVLVRLFAALDHSSGLQSEVCQRAMDQLNHLANDIGIAWDGNVPARAPSLDPQSYSQEVMNAQSARLDTNKRLLEALHILLENRCYGCRGEKLFVLPIDDFYLKPAASLELLRLLRMISVPNLFFLIMGDIKTMEALFFEKALKDWTGVAGPQIFASLEAQKKDEVLARVREMKARYLRKLLPTAQRSTIEWSSWDEALRYRPTTAEASSDAPRLSTLLLGVSIELMDGISPLPNNLLDYLVAPSYKAPTTMGHDNGSKEVNEHALTLEANGECVHSRLRTFREAYSALSVLDATPREVVDLWMHLSELRRRSKDASENIPAYLWTVADFALLAIEEQDFLTEQQQEPVRYAFPASHKDDLLIETAHFELVPKVSPRIRTVDENIFVRSHLDWKLGINIDNLNHTTSAPNHLPPRTAAWIILMHDLAWSWQQSSLTYNLVNELVGKDKNVDISTTGESEHPGAHDSGWAWYVDEGTWIHLPVPRFNTFRRLDRFLAIWNAGLVKSVGSLSLGTIANLWGYAAWIAMGTEGQYEKFVMKQSFSEGEKASLTDFRADLFRGHSFLASSVNEGEC